MVDRTQIKVHLVGAGPGDPGLLTIRGLECLQNAEVVIFDRLVNPVLLQYAPQAEWIDAGKQPDHHPMPQSEINALLVKKALEGKKVVRLKGGDPYVFGRGGEEAIELSKAGIAFEIVPGITSAIAAPAYAGIPVTHRGVSQSVSFITGHSAKEDNLPEKWSCLAGSGGTLVFLMGVHNLPEITQHLLAGGLSPKTPVALIEQGTCTGQRTITGTLEDIVDKAKHIQPPTIIIVGEVVKLRDSLRWYDKPVTCPLMGVNIGITQTGAPSLTSSRNDHQSAHLPQGDTITEFSRKLSLLGAMPVQIPTFRIKPASDSDALWRVIQSITSSNSPEKPYTWILFSCVEAIDIFFKQFKELKKDLRSLSELKFGTIGLPSAGCLKGYMIIPDLQVIETGDNIQAEQLAVLTNEHILFIHTAPISPELSSMLREIQARVDEIQIAEFEPLPLSASTINSIKTGTINILTFFTPASVSGFVDSFFDTNNNNIPSSLAHTVIACSDPITAYTAQKLDLKVDILTKDPSPDTMISAITAWAKKTSI